MSAGFSEFGVYEPGVGPPPRGADLRPSAGSGPVALTADQRRLRVLVAIASYGAKNREFLKRIIQSYRKLPLHVDIVVLSEAPKDIGPGVEVLVGLPSRNPWSLPFAHKAIFAERLEAYDLFAFSEDDMEVTEANIGAFLCATPQLASDEIAGFLRYEVDASGNRSLPEVHGSAHWKPESARRRGDYIIAEFSNEHAGFYLLTRAQLRRAITSGGFLRGPCEGRYDMLCTAATDPYTNCGMRKVICISALEEFLIHHVPNQYAGRLGLPLASFAVQVQALLDICNNAHPLTKLCDVESSILQGTWSKSYYESPCEEFLAMVPKEARRILSVGCGSSASEMALHQRGFAVTVLPLDSVIGSVAARRGLEVLYASLAEGLSTLEGRRFDAVLLSNLLHLLPDPPRVLDQCARLLRPGGVLVMAGPNFDYLPVLARRISGAGAYRKLRHFSESSVHPLSIGQINRSLRTVGLDPDRLIWRSHDGPGPLSGSVAKPHGLAAVLDDVWRSVRELGMDLQLGRLMAPNWQERAIKRR